MPFSHLLFMALKILKDVISLLYIFPTLIMCFDVAILAVFILVFLLVPWRHFYAVFHHCQFH